MRKVFSWMLGVLASIEGLIDGLRRFGACDRSPSTGWHRPNAAMRSDRAMRDTGEQPAYKSRFRDRRPLAKASRHLRRRPERTWSPTGPKARLQENGPRQRVGEQSPAWTRTARITRRSEGSNRTHLAHKVEHAADMKTGAIQGRLPCRAPTLGDGTGRLSKTGMIEPLARFRCRDTGGRS